VVVRRKAANFKENWNNRPINSSSTPGHQSSWQSGHQFSGYIAHTRKRTGRRTQNNSKGRYAKVRTRLIRDFGIKTVLNILKETLCVLVSELT